MEYEGEERCEPIFGRPYVTPSPSCLHQVVTMEIAVRLRASAIRSGGLALCAPMDVVLADHSVVQPDVLDLAPANRLFATHRVRGIPDPLVEVLSPTSGRRDRMVERKLYADTGVPETWIVDPQAEQTDFYRLEIELDVESFWADVRRMAPDEPSA